MVDPILGVLHGVRRESDEMDSGEHQTRIPVEVLGADSEENRVPEISAQAVRVWPQQFDGGNARERSAGVKDRFGNT
jgi:hypothetical protein